MRALRHFLAQPCGRRWGAADGAWATIVVSWYTSSSQSTHRPLPIPSLRRTGRKRQTHVGSSGLSGRVNSCKHVNITELGGGKVRGVLFQTLTCGSDSGALPHCAPASPVPPSPSRDSATSFCSLCSPPPPSAPPPSHLRPSAEPHKSARSQKNNTFPCYL